jgi:hypothetical protein
MLTQNQIEKLESIEEFMRIVEEVEKEAQELAEGKTGQGPGRSWRLTTKTCSADRENAAVVFEYLLSVSPDKYVGVTEYTNRGSGYKILHDKGPWLALKTVADEYGRASGRRSTRFTVPSTAVDIVRGGDEDDDLDDDGEEV